MFVFPLDTTRHLGVIIILLAGIFRSVCMSSTRYMKNKKRKKDRWENALRYFILLTSFTFTSGLILISWPVSLHPVYFHLFSVNIPLLSLLIHGFVTSSTLFSDFTLPLPSHLHRSLSFLALSLWLLGVRGLSAHKYQWHALSKPSETRKIITHHQPLLLHSITIPPLSSSTSFRLSHSLSFHFFFFLPLSFRSFPSGTIQSVCIAVSMYRAFQKDKQQLQ